MRFPRRRYVADAPLSADDKKRVRSINDEALVGANINRADHADCGCHHENLMLLRHVTRDPLEILIISVVRFTMAGYCTGKVGCWDVALTTVINIRGPLHGPILLARTLALVHAIRNERTVDYRFMPGNCERISEDEVDLVVLIQAARSGDSELLEGLAAMFARNPETPQLHLSVSLLIEMLEQQAQVQKTIVQTSADIDLNATRH